TALPDVRMQEIAEDDYFDGGTALAVRIRNRLSRPWQRLRLHRATMATIASQKTCALMVYKGHGVPAATIRAARQAGVFTVNVFPDYSPHAYGAQLKAAMGEYDLVVSTKPFHPAGWKSIYAYDNRCVFVPHGYDPGVHLWTLPSTAHDFDVLLAATWRRQYQDVMQSLSVALAGRSLRVGIVGSGWTERRHELPGDWHVAPAVTGRAYGEWLRRGRIVIAPVHREVIVDGVRQPGDEDTIRTYELAAMSCFFLHRRTPYVQTLYDERTEVPMWDNAEELAQLVLQYLPLEKERGLMAARAHARAVPAHSFTNRAMQVLEHVKAGLAGKRLTP
ncbi:MAG: glycosyltransferase, partial [Vicinamibacterales bacterium]